MTTLRVKGITNLSLLCYSCPCGRLNILGFWHQIEEKVEKDEGLRQAKYKGGCDVCGKPFVKRFRLTTGKRPPHRLCPWVDWGFTVCCSRWAAWLPVSFWRGLIGMFLWLEGRYPL